MNSTIGINLIDFQFQCCGSDDYSSWALSMYSRIEFEENINSIDYIFAVPQSCCINPLSETCQQNRKITTNQFVEEFIYTQAIFSFLSFEWMTLIVNFSAEWISQIYNDRDAFQNSKLVSFHSGNIAYWSASVLV